MHETSHNTPIKERGKIPPSAWIIFALGRFLAKIPMPSLASACLGHLKAKRHRIQGLDVVRASLKSKEGNLFEAIEMVKEELRLFPGNDEAARLLKQFSERAESVDAQPILSMPEEFRRLYQQIKPYTMLSAQRLLALYEGAKLVCRENLPGNFAECGVAGGGSSAMLAYVIQTHSQTRRFLYAFDTFEGLPRPGPQDVVSGISAFDIGWGEGTCAAPVGSLRQIAEKLGVWESIVPVKGLFQDTLASKRNEVGELALLHLDGDWYDSTKCIFESLYDLICAGGYLQVDDYGCWEGCRKATDEFEKSRGLSFEKRPIDSSGVYFRKCS